MVRNFLKSKLIVSVILIILFIVIISFVIKLQTIMLVPIFFVTGIFVGSAILLQTSESLNDTRIANATAGSPEVKILQLNTRRYKGWRLVFTIAAFTLTFSSAWLAKDYVSEINNAVIGSTQTVLDGQFNQHDAKVSRQIKAMQRDIEQLKRDIFKIRSH